MPTSRQDDLADGRDHPFFIVDNAVLLDYGPQIGAIGVAVYTAIAVHASGKGVRTAFPSYGTLARLLDLSRPTVIKAVQKLAAAGLVTVTVNETTAADGRTRHSTNTYTLCRICPPSKAGLLGKEINQGVGKEIDHPSKADLPPLVNEVDHPSKGRLPEQDVINQTQLEPDPINQPPVPPTPRSVPKPGSGFDYPALWALITEQQGYKPTWSYPVESRAVGRLLTAYPTATESDFARFLAYLSTVWPFCNEPDRQPTFSQGAPQFGKWFTNGQPAVAAQGDHHAKPAAYETRSERQLRRTADIAALVTGYDPAGLADEMRLRLPAGRAGSG